MFDDSEPDLRQTARRYPSPMGMFLYPQGQPFLTCYIAALRDIATGQSFLDLDLRTIVQVVRLVAFIDRVDDQWDRLQPVDWQAVIDWSDTP